MIHDMIINYYYWMKKKMNMVGIRVKTIPLTRSYIDLTRHPSCNWVDTKPYFLSKHILDILYTISATANLPMNCHNMIYIKKFLDSCIYQQGLSLL